MRRGLGVASALLCLGLMVLVFSRSADRGRFAVPYSTYGAGPEGGRGLFLLAASLGGRPQRWVQDLSGLPSGALLMAMGDCEHGLARPLSRYEQTELSRWVAGGGHLIVAGVRGFVPDTFGINFASDRGCDSAEASSLFDTSDEGQSEGSAPAEPGRRKASGSAMSGDAPLDAIARAHAAEGGALEGIDGLPMVRPGHLVLEPKLEHEVLATIPDAVDMPLSSVQRLAAVRVPHGHGSLVVFASASLFQNRYLEVADGGVAFARLFGALAPRGPLLFDEYHLGVGERRSAMRYLRQHGLFPVIAQLAVVALLLLLRMGTRFGALERPAPEPPLGTASFVSALGGLFARTQDRAAAAEILARDARRRIATHYHLPGLTAAKLVSELARRGQPGAAQAVADIQAAVGVRGGGLKAACLAIDEAVRRACGGA